MFPCAGAAALEDLVASPAAVRTALVTTGRLMQWRVSPSNAATSASASPLHLAGWAVATGSNGSSRGGDATASPREARWIPLPGMTMNEAFWWACFCTW